MRDFSRVVIAEDDGRIADSLKEVLSHTGGLQVWTVSRVRDIVEELEKSGAAWLILDLELEDGPADILLPELRRRYKTDLIILILTGKAHIFKESLMLKSGADVQLRKPFDPEALLLQMQNLRRGSLPMASPQSRLLLRFRDRTIDLDAGEVRTATETILLSRTQASLLNLLANARNADGAWLEIPSKTIWAKLYGTDADEAPEQCSSRLRNLCARLDDALGGDAIDRSGRGNNRQSVYVLSSEVQLIAEDAHA